MQKKKFIFSDRLVACLFYVFIVTYLGWAGYKIIGSGTNVPIDLSLLIMIIPVFLSDGIKTVIESLAIKKKFKLTEDLSKVTVVIPTYNGEKVLQATLSDLVKRFPPSSIIVASNGSTDQSCKIAAEAGARVLDIADPIGKVEAINRGLDLVETQYTLILDDDTLIGNAIIPTSILDEGYQGVAFTVLPVKKGFWSILQAHEYRKSMSIGKNYHNHSGSVQNISGAIGLFKTEELKRQALVHTGEFSGEDLQRTLLIHLSDKDGGVVMTDQIVETICPESFSDLAHQRVFGWYPGFLSNFMRYTKLITKRGVGKRLRYEAFYNIFILAILDPVRIITLPILIFTPLYIVFFYILYVGLEIIPYLRMGMKEPFWVVLIFPLYGLFNFIARIISMSVFFYRRLTAIIGKAKKFDDYKFMRLPARITGTIGASLASISITASYGFINSSVIDMQHHLIVQAQERQMVQLNLAPPKVVGARSTRERGFKYIVTPGDTAWKLGEKAVDEYMDSFDINSEDVNKSLWVHWVVSMSQEKEIKVNQEYFISEQTLKQAYQLL